MDVIVDTCVWSAAMRRAQPDAIVSAELGKLIRQGRARMLGLIRQELLTGIRHRHQFELLKDRLRAFPDVAVTRATHELAADIANACIAKGRQGSHADFLICAAAKLEKLPIYSLDQDFRGFATVVGLQLHRP